MKWLTVALMLLAGAALYEAREIKALREAQTSLGQELDNVEGKMGIDPEAVQS